MSSRTFSRTIVFALFLGATIPPWAQAADARRTDGRAAVILHEISSRVTLPSLAELLQSLVTKDDGRGGCPGGGPNRPPGQHPPGHHPGYPGGPGGPGNGDEGSGACPGGGPRR